MKFFMITALAVALGLAMAVAACNDGGGAVSSSVRSVDSAAAAVPDTIKPLSLDSAARRDTTRRDSARHGL